MSECLLRAKGEHIARWVTVLPVLLIAAWSLLLVFGTEAAGSEKPLTYFSDYFSFVGADEQGQVAFAIDTNRGQDGDEFQAEHFIVLHDEDDGWQRIKGTGSYPNSNGELETIPNSRYFRFQGAPEKGVVIEGSVNNVILHVHPISMHISRRVGNQEKRLGSAPATLEWRGRTLKGRVIYEFIHFENWNRLTRTYWGFWRDFQGFYLVVGDTVTKKSSDFYLASQKTEGGRGKQRESDGFAILNGSEMRLKDAKVVVEKSDLTLGLYRWPRRWSGQWPANGAKPEKDEDKIRFRFNQVSRKSFGNWVIGGFAMSVVRGEVSYRGRTLPVYGLGEFIK